MRSHRFCSYSLFCALLLGCIFANPARSGTNEGFKASVEPRAVRNPEIGQIITVPVLIEGAKEAKGGLVTAHFDPAVFSFEAFTAGPWIPGMLTLPAPVTEGEDGFSIAQGGGTQLGGVPATGSGLFGSMAFKVVSEIPPSGSFISFTKIQIQAGSTDKDSLITQPRQFGVKVIRSFPNVISDMDIKRSRNSAVLNWRTKESGINDTVFFRAKGEELFRTAISPLLKRTTPRMIRAIRVLLENKLVPREATPEQIREVLANDPKFEGEEITGAFIDDVKILDDALGNRRHVVSLGSLQPNTEYEFIARSYDLNDRSSAPFNGDFNTRREIDRRPLFMERFEVQSTPFTAIIRWFTNRPSDTRYAFEAGGADTASEIIADEDGTQVHIVEIRDLEPNTRYKFTVSSRLTDADTFLSEGMTETDVNVTRIDSLMTRRANSRLSFIGPPFRIVGTEEVRLRVRLNQPAGLRVDYAALEDGQKLRDVVPTYTDTTFSDELLESHDIALSDLNSSTLYRFRLTAFNTTDTLTTDPTGNQQFSRDLNFRTSADSDTLDPVIIAGPQVLARGKVAVVSWTTDVPTTGKVYVGSVGTDATLGTSDEVEYAALSANGSNHFAPRHTIVVTGLTIGTEYGYRIESTTANGKTVVFDPKNSTAAKRAKVLQPPGGSGSFTTDSTADTQFPVILSGPSVSSQTDASAVIEWKTDEPANSEIAFGTGDSSDGESSGDSETSHKIVLSNLDAGTTYTYTIGSTDAAGNGVTESSQATFTTNPDIDLTAPAISSLKISYKNDETATVNWATDEEATAEVEFGTSEALGTIRTLSTTGETHEVTLTNLSAGTTYYYSVSSSDLSSNGPTVSDTLNFTTDAEPDLLPPGISAIETVVTDSAAFVSWATDELADSYVEFGTEQALLEFNIGATEDVIDHDITLTNLTPGTTYYYIVGSVDRANNPPTESDTLNFTTSSEADTTAPSVPFDLSATPGSRQVVLTWDAAVELDLNGFNIYRRTGSDDFALLSSGQQKLAFTDLNVGNDTAYDYHVTAIDRQNPPNESTASTSASATPTTSAAPTTPTELSRSGDFLTPTFNFANASPFNTDSTLTYTIQVSTESNFSNVTSSVSGLVENSGDSGTGQTAWTIARDLEEGSTYYWRVRAVEGNLKGEFSAADQFLAVDPSSLAGDFNGDGSVDFDDFFLFVDFFGQKAEGDAVAYDLDGGGSVDFNDFFTFVDNFGKTIAGKRWAAPTETDARARFALEAFGGTRQQQQRITVRLWADQVQELKSYGAALNYDPQQVVFEGARPGPGALLESRGGSAPLFSVLYQRPGHLVIGNGLTDGEAVSGRGLLAELDFRLLGHGTEAAFDLAEGYVASSGEQIKAVVQLSSARLVPRQYALFANFPNPFNPSTSIEYALPEAAEVALVIYDVLGQTVQTLVANELQGAGYYHLTWDGRDQAGHGVSSGMYFYRLATQDFEQTRKMILLK
jgi:hypothetical protein